MRLTHNQRVIGLKPLKNLLEKKRNLKFREKVFKVCSRIFFTSAHVCETTVSRGLVCRRRRRRRRQRRRRQRRLHRRAPDL